LVLKVEGDIMSRGRKVGKMLRGDRLRRLRLDSGFSTDRLAIQLGMSKSQYLRYENEKSDATSGVVRRIATFYGVSADFVLGLSDDERIAKEGLLSTEEATLISFLRRKEFVQVQRMLYAFLLKAIYGENDVPLEVYRDTQFAASLGKFDSRYDSAQAAESDQE